MTLSVSAEKKGILSHLGVRKSEKSASINHTDYHTYYVGADGRLIYEAWNAKRVLCHLPPSLGQVMDICFHHHTAALGFASGNVVIFDLPHLGAWLEEINLDSSKHLSNRAALGTELDPDIRP